MIKVIEFERICRNCRTNYGGGVITVVTDDFPEYLHEYDISEYLEKMFIKNEENCDYCGANNYDFSEIKINGEEILNINKLKKEYDGLKNSFLHITLLDIKPDGTLKFEIDKSDYNSINGKNQEIFISIAMDFLINEVDNVIEPHKFVKDKHPYFETFLVTDFKNTDCLRLQYFGLSKFEF